MAVRIVKTRKVAVTRPPLLRKMAARADFDDVYVRYAFMVLETPVSGTCNVEEDGRLQCIAIATSVRVTGSADKRMGPRSG